jgi:hypothetical protein
LGNWKDSDAITEIANPGKVRADLRRTMMD